MKSFDNSAKGKAIAKSHQEKGIENKPKKKGKNGEEEDDADEDDNGGEASAEGSGEASAEDQKDGLRNRGKRQTGPKAFVKKVKSQKAEKDDDAMDKKASTKESRHWGNTPSGKRASESVIKSLDHSKNPVAESDLQVQMMREQFLGSGDEDDDAEVASLSSGDEDVPKGKESTSRVGGLFKKLTTGVKNITGGAVLKDEDLEPILVNFKQSLMARNVAAEVADKLADSVRASMVGKTTEKFTSMGSTVKTCIMEAMERLLTPKKSIDVLRDAMTAKRNGKVYTIVFLGVNGVGKSTNLAKVAYYLKHKGGLDVLICACDTFRAGAVEQLKTHSRCLDVPLFERGYGKDPSDIAKAAIAHAEKEGHDVVLVDTAGRMQDNEPLMRALAKLVAVNSPDLVLFVGEALVGNDAIDQVTKFNQALVDFSFDRKNPRGIDGMLLTKYDTVDDKVGAALSMVYVTGQPIVFVGCGQKYTHLRKLDVKEVCNTLLS